jgi:ferrous iron transport protein A
MTLCDGKNNHSYIVQSISLESATQIRLKALGLTDGTNITILNNKRGGSVIFTVRGTRLAVGKQIAKEIEILGLSEDENKCKKN